MKIKIIAVGHIKEKYWSDAINEYVKRLSSYSKVEIIELDDEAIPAHSNESLDEQVKTKEGKKILTKIKDGEYVVALDLNHPQKDSVSFAKDLNKMFISGGSNVTFVIGGSLGLSTEVKERSNSFLTISEMTFPHQMCRVILLEQIYRAFKINNNETYHK